MLLTKQGIVSSHVIAILKEAKLANCAQPLRILVMSHLKEL